MAFILHLDHPSQFTVYLDGAAHGHVRREGLCWVLYPLTEPKASVDVTDVLLMNDELESLVRGRRARP